MIGDILKIVTKETSDYLDEHLKMPGGKKSVVLHKPNATTGEFDIPENTVSLSLLNIEEESAMKSTLVKKQVIDGKVYKTNPAIKLNLYIIFIPNFKNDYQIELNTITKIIEFFHGKPIFNKGNTQGFAELKLGEVKFSMQTLPFKEINNIWSVLGGRYLPSVVYKVGIISIQEEPQLINAQITQRVDIVTKQK